MSKINDDTAAAQLQIFKSALQYLSNRAQWIGRDSDVKREDAAGSKSAEAGNHFKGKNFVARILKAELE